ncbi:hypothetical protein MBLNU457_4086t1 [Dothideomycetes sp. NU457]
MHERYVEKDSEKNLDHTSSQSLSKTPSPEDASPELPPILPPPAVTENVLEEAEEHHEGETAEPSRSRRSRSRSFRPRPSSRSSSVYREAVKVPRSERRGLLAGVTVIAEVSEPKDLANKTKWMITAVVALAAAAAPMGSSIILPALEDIAKAFDTTPTVTNLSVAFYMLSMSIFPLWWSSFSETLGRRTIYVVSFGIFLLFNILSAVSVNIAMFVVMRILSGGASASVQAVGAGTIADIWAVKERGRAMGFFYLGPLCGPLIAPILGGILAQKLGWRSCLWSQAIFGLFLWFMILFFLPETLAHRRSLAAEAEAEATVQVADDEKTTEEDTSNALTRTTTRQSAKVKVKKYGKILRRVFLEPLAIVLHLRKPAVAITVYYASITFGSLYLLNISVQQIFAHSPYNYPVIIVGLLYIPNSVGYFFASLFGGRWIDHIMHREARKAGRYDDHGKLMFRPEDRMKENAWLAAFMYPTALIWYGWTADKGVNVAAPMIANFFFGIGSMLIFGCITTMLSEFMPDQSSHGIAVNNFVRNILSCIATIVAEPLIVAIGNGWLFTIAGIWCLLSGIIVLWTMGHYAASWAERAERKAADNKKR